jgi:hypothetical protein
MSLEFEQDLRELELELLRELYRDGESATAGPLEAELAAGANPVRSPGPTLSAQPAAVSCPAPAQLARDRCLHPGTQTCLPIPNLLCAQGVAGIPFDYVLNVARDSRTGLVIVSGRQTPRTERFIPAVQTAAAAFVGNMSRFGLPIEAILSLGSLYCRCVSNSDTLSNHSFGDALDVAGVRWAASGGPASATRETIVHNWNNERDPNQRALLRRINACLRLSFNTVIDYHRDDHRDHFHCDTNRRAGSVRSLVKSETTTPHFVQESLTLVLGRPIAETGQWDNPTWGGLQEFSGVDVTVLKQDRNRLNAVLDQLFTRVASGTAAPPAGPMGLDHFPFNGTALSAYQGRLVDRLARRIAASWSSANPIRGIHLTGHTDSTGATSYNKGLGLRRARAVATALGRSILRKRPDLAGKISMVTHSLGATRPVVSGRSEAARARNRRVTVALVGVPAPASRQAELVENEGLPELPAPGPVPAVAAPPLLYSETTVPAETHYVTITLGEERPASPMTGIFVPRDYRIPSQVDLILYLQGHHKGGAFPEDLSIDDYWNVNRFPFWGFREGVNASNKNVILVAPTLGPTSNAGRLKAAGGLAWYLDQVMAALKSYGPFKGASSAPPLGSIVIACHSGGGIVMRQIALTPQKYLDNLQECWGFDCLYNPGEETQWVDWAKANPAKRLFIHYGNGGTAPRSRQLQANAHGLSNVSVGGSESVPHNRVPITHWQERLAAARFLLSR